MKIIANYPDYAITKDGKIWSNKTGRWLKPSLVCGYFNVILCKNGKHCGCSIHRLILESFVGQCPPGMQCRHLNGVRTDNRLENLKWGTRSENQQDAVKHGTHAGLRCGEKHNGVKLTEKDVKTVIKMYKTGEFTQEEIAKLYNVYQTHVSKIVNKKTWKHIVNG